MKVIITGGLGFIGSNLIKFLLQKKDIKKIIIIDKQSIKKSSYINKICKFKYFANAGSYKSSKFRVDVVRSNVYNYSDALLVCRNTDYIVHLAAESGIDVSVNEPYKSFKTNILGAFNYLDAARIGNVKGFIFASSSAVFGDTKPPSQGRHGNKFGVVAKPDARRSTSAWNLQTTKDSMPGVSIAIPTMLVFWPH